MHICPPLSGQRPHPQGCIGEHLPWTRESFLLFAWGNVCPAGFYELGFFPRFVNRLLQGPQGDHFIAETQQGQDGEFLLLDEEQAAALPFRPLKNICSLIDSEAVCLFGAAELPSGRLSGPQKFGVSTTDLWLLAFDLCYPSSLVNIFFYNCKYCFLTKKQRF